MMIKNFQSNAFIRIRRSLVLAAFGLTILAQSSQAGLIQNVGTQPGNRSFTGGTIGTEFVVGEQDLSVTSLGFEDPGGVALQVSHQVGLWTSTGSLLASVTVPAGTGGTFIDGWRYVDIAPITLSSGSEYVLGAETTGSFDMFSDLDSPGGEGTAFAFGSGLIAGNPVNVFSYSGFTFPNSDGEGTPLRWAPANAQFTPVPEPASIALLGLGGVALMSYTRRARVRSRG